MNIKRFTFLFVTVILGLLLTSCTGAPVTAWPGVTVGDMMVYLADNQFVYGVNIADGAEVWRFPAKAEANKTFFAEPVLTEDGQLLVGDYKTGFYSLNPQTGALNWETSVPTGKKVGSPLAVDGSIYVPSGDGNVYAMDSKGNVQWQFKTGQGNWSQPIAGQSSIMFGSLDHYVYAVDFSAKRELWKVDLGAAVVGKPTLAEGGLLYAGSLGREIVAINPADGKIAWRKPTTGAVWNGPAVHEDVIYFGDSMGMLYALDAATGAEKWSKQQEGAILGTPAVLPDRFVFATDAGNLVAMDFSGTVIWPRKIDGKLYAPPVFINDRLFVPVNDADSLLLAMDKDGNQQWGFVPAK